MSAYKQNTSKRRWHMQKANFKDKLYKYLEIKQHRGN
jgi:hypothetical protein